MKYEMYVKFIATKTCFIEADSPEEAQKNLEHKLFDRYKKESLATEQTYRQTKMLELRVGDYGLLENIKPVEKII